METLKSLRDQVLTWLDEAGDTGSTKTNVTNALNICHQQRCTMDRWSFMERGAPLTFALVASQQYYPLHEEFGRPKYFYNQTTKTFLQEVPPRQFDQGVDWNSDSSGIEFCIQSYSPVKTQPTSASVVTIVSTSALDITTSKQVIVRGDTATTGVRSDTIIPTGTSSAAGTVSFTRILDVTLSAAWSGTLTMTSNSGAVTNLTLYAGEYGKQYPQLRLLWVPSATDTIEYDFYHLPRTLTNDYDVPQIPFPYSQILVYDALLMLAAYDNQTDPGRLRIWMDGQERLEIQMRQHFIEGQSLNAKVRYVRLIDDGQDFV